MRPLPLSALLLLAPAALADGAPAPASRPEAAPMLPGASGSRTLPATSPVQPGQTWVMSGTTFGGEGVNLTFNLAQNVPEWDGGWNLNADRGVFTYNPDDRTVVVVDLLSQRKKNPINVCAGLMEGRSARGLLFSGPFTRVDAQISAIGNKLDAPQSSDDLIRRAKKLGLKVGSCTMTRR